MKEWADTAQNFSVIIASVAVFYGIDAWRREFVGKLRIELAEEVLALFYQARDIIESIRSPFGFGGEGETRKPSPNESPEHKEALDQAYVLIERYNRHVEVFSRIRALRYRFMAQFDSNASKPFDDLNRTINELILSAQQKARYSTQSFQSNIAAEKHQKKFLEVDSIYYSGSEEDPIAPRVEAIIEDIESTCKKVIESRSTLFSIINLRLWK